MPTPGAPWQPVVIALEGHQVVTSVTFEVGEWKALAGKHTVLPAQQQEVLMAGTNLGPKPKGISQKPKAKAEEGFSFTGPKQSIYGSAEPYPATVVRLTGTSYRNDSTFVQALVYPVRYIGAERRLEVCREVKVKVEIEGRAKAEARGQKREPRMADAGTRTSRNTNWGCRSANVWV